jgi:hypothetical protein
MDVERQPRWRATLSSSPTDARGGIVKTTLGTTA